MPTSDQAREAYCDKLLLALRMRDVPGDRIGEVLAEVEAHLAETGEDPVEAFGPPATYAAAVADVPGARSPWRIGPGVVVGSVLIAVATYLATSWTTGGVLGLVAGDGGEPGPFGLPPGAELVLGLVVGAVALAVLVGYAGRHGDVVVDPRTGRPRGLPSLGWVPFAVLAGLVAVTVVLALVVDRL